MATTAPLTAKDVTQFSKNIASPGPTAGPTFYEYAKTTEALARRVETDWENFPPDVKELLTCLAYDAINPRKRDPLAWGRRIRFATTVAVALFRGDTEALLAFKSAVIRLNNAILSAIEAENPTYQADLNSALESLTFDPDAGTAVDQDNIREHLRELSGQALREL